MSRSDRLVLSAAVFTLIAVAGTTACSLGNGNCLRMSDCERGYACVDGVCESPVATDAQKASASARSSDSDAGSTDAATD